MCNQDVLHFVVKSKICWKKKKKNVTFIRTWHVLNYIFYKRMLTS